MANVMAIAIPLFFLMIFVEWWLGRRKAQKIYRLNDTIVNLNLGIGSQVFNILTKGFIFLIIIYVYQNWSFFKIPFTWWSFMVCLVLFDFIYYWVHRWSHEWNYLWGAHVVHHQSEEYNLSVALRQPWFHHLIAFVFFLPVPLLGFDPICIGVVSITVTLYQFWIHTKVIDRMPKWFEFVFNSPTHHRVHHAVNKKYIDKNHAAVFIVWDRIFGTFQAEEEEVVYGTTSQFTSFNTVKANVGFYVWMWNSIKGASWWQKIKMLVARPGWTPEGPKPIELIENVDLQRKKFNPSVPKGFTIYAVLQFVLLLWGTYAYLNNFDVMPLIQKILFASLIIFSTVIIGGVLELKKWVFFAEYARLMIVGFSINTLYYFSYNNWFLLMLTLSIVGLTTCYVWFSVSLGKNYKSIFSFN